jgi:hypothetical protein
MPMAEKNTAKRESVKRSIMERILQLVLQGKLLRTKNADFCEQIRIEFAEQIKEADYKLHLRTFHEWLDDVIWNMQDGEKNLIKMMRERVPNPAEEYQHLHPYIPLEMIRLRIKKIRGIISFPKRPKFVRGILHIDFPDDLQLRTMTAYGHSEPFVIPKVPGYEGKCVLVNGANLGIIHTPVIAENIVRLAFADAEDSKSRALIIPGGMFALDLKRAGGPLKALRAMSLGRNINVDILDPQYQAKALRVLQNHPRDAMVYETLAEAFANLLSGWHKATNKPKDTAKNGTQTVKEQPEYNGPVYILMGRAEEELVAAIAYWKMRYFTVVEQNRLHARIQVARNAIAHLGKQIEQELSKRPNNQDRRYMRLLARQLEEAETRLEKLIAEHSRTRITNSSVEDFQRFIRLAYSYVVREIESAIPNCAVIGSGTQVAKLDGKIIEFYIPSHNRVTPGLLANYASGCGPKILRETMAEHVFVCHPHAIYPNGTAREADADSLRGYARLTVAPICTDSEYYRERTSMLIRRDTHAMSRVAYDERHVPGILRFGVESGMVQADVVPADILLMRERMKKNDEYRRMAKLPPQYMWGMIATDQHWGGPSKCFVSKPNTNGLRQRYGMNEAVFDMLRSAGVCTPKKMPVHFWWAMDDMVQGRHFENQNQPHPHLIPYYVMDELFTEAYNQASTFDNARAQLKKMSEIVLYQMERSGPVWTQDQIETALKRHIEPNVDIFSAILGSAVRAEIHVTGISNFAHILEDAVVMDRRDVGLIVPGTGNHYLSTVKKETMEGPIYAFHLRGLLGRHAEWMGKDVFLEKHVCSPRDGNQFFGYGTYQAGNGYEYPIELRDAPTKIAGYGDVLLGHVTNDIQRGNYMRFLNKKVKITAVGNNHFFAFSYLPWGFFVMGPPGVETDVYGQHGFPPNNTGVVFLGLPVKGPAYAPLLVRPLLYQDIRRFVEAGSNIDWRQFLTNPV